MAVKHEAFGRQPHLARVKIELHDEVREGGALKRVKETVVHDRVQLAGRRELLPRMFQGPKGTIIFATPLVSYLAKPVGIADEDIEKVTWVWPHFPGQHLAPRADVRGGAERASTPVGRFGIMGSFPSAGIPLAATVHLKNGAKLRLSAFVGDRSP